jgi:hypothetical protein
VTYNVASDDVCLLYPSNGAVKLGADFPIKMYLCDAMGNDVSSSTLIVHATQLDFMSGSASGDMIAETGNSNPDMDFRFDSTLGPSGGYIFNFKTTNLQPNSAYNLLFTVSGQSSPNYLAPLATK